MNDWRSALDHRIRQHRMGRLGLRFSDATGRPIADRPVRCRQRATTCRIGTAVGAGMLARDDDDAQHYRQVLLDHFNILVDENHAKWYSTEREPGVLDWSGADRIIDFAQAHDLPLRGHCLFWDREKWVHDWVRELDDAALAVAVERRLEDAVAHCRGKVTCWDVLNEILDGGWYESRLPGSHVRIFRRAAELDPAARLFVNEFGILGGGAKRERYCRLIEELRAAGAPVGGCGVQEHACERFTTACATAMEQAPAEIERMHHARLSPDEMLADLDSLAALAPVHLTEVSCKSVDETVRAVGLETCLRTAMAHPGVEAVLLWGFWAGRHWLGSEACLWEQDWRPTAAAAMLQDLLEQWRTDVDLTTDAEGAVQWEGFFGSYRITGPDGRDRELDLTPGQPTASCSC